MALPSRPQEQGPPVSGDPPPASLLPRKASLPNLARLLPRSRQRGLEGVGATPKPTIRTKEQVYVSQSHYPDRLYRPGAKDIRHTIRQRDHALVGCHDQT